MLGVAKTEICDNARSRPRFLKIYNNTPVRFSWCIVYCKEQTSDGDAFGAAEADQPKMDLPLRLRRAPGLSSVAPLFFPVDFRKSMGYNLLRISGCVTTLNRSPTSRWSQDFPFPRQSMFPRSSGSWMPVAVSMPAAWKAFACVTSETPWRITIPSLTPVTFDIEFDPDFQAHLDNAGSFDFPAKARGAIATRILEITASLTEALLRRKGFDPEVMATSPVVSRHALDALKTYVTTKIQNELTLRCDPGASAWADQVELELLGVSREHRETLRAYFGFDQILDAKAIRQGTNYVFQSMNLDVRSWSGGVCLLGNDRKLRETRQVRGDAEPKVRARRLVLGCIEKILPEVAASPAGAEDGLDVLEVCRLVLDERVRLHGCWGLIDITVEDSRPGLLLEELITDRLRELLETQRQRGATLTAGILQGGLTARLGARE